jgi:hypothetical protein
LPKPGQPLSFLVSLHEEGTGITWQQNVTVEPETERFFLDTTHELYLWSINAALTAKGAQERVSQLGTRLYECFVGLEGTKVLDVIVPTAVLLDADETILNLPWELIGTGGDAIAQEKPFGRLVTTRIIPRQSRDPLSEDKVVRVLAVANPTLDLSVGEAEVEALRELQGNHGGFSIEVKLLTRDKATRVAFKEMMADGDYDILHFAGHGSFDPTAPESSAIRFADGMFTANEVLDLKWKAPPYLVLNSTCESGRAAGGLRLVSELNQGNGIAAAFLAAGVSGYAGYFWPVTEAGAGLFSKVFYKTLFQRENVGVAFLEARRRVIRELQDVGDLTGYSAVLYGDAASKHRRDLAMAA